MAKSKIRPQAPKRREVVVTIPKGWKLAGNLSDDSLSVVLARMAAK